MLIYLHGFRSSPASEKSRLLHARMEERGLVERFWCEQLPISPKEAISTVEKVINGSKNQPLLVGSSLGGFYSTYLAETHHLDAVLINPATHADRLLNSAIGTQTNIYSGETFEFIPEYVNQLKKLVVTELKHPERFWLLLETGDEVLDYQEAVVHYAGAKQSIIEGGTHNFINFPAYTDSIINHYLAISDNQPH